MKHRNTVIISIVLIVIIICIAALFSRNRQGTVNVAPQATLETTPILDEISLALGSSDVTIKKDDIFTVRVTKNPTQLLQAIDLLIRYDPTIFEIQDIKPGTYFVHSTEYYRKINNSTGSIVYSVGSLTTNNDDRTVAIITFRALKNGKGFITIDKNTIASLQGAKKAGLKSNVSQIYTVQ